MTVGICDDSKQCRIEVVKMLEFVEVSVELEISEYESAEQLLEMQVMPEVIFLGIEMGGMSGIELLKKHAALFKNSKVILLTAYDDFWQTGYEVNAYRYITKPVSDRKDKFVELFEAIEVEKGLNDSLTFLCNKKSVTVKYRDILYIEKAKSKNHINIVASNHDFQCSMPLKDIYDAIPHDIFVYSHRSIIINIKQIKHINISNNVIMMNNNQMLPVSRKNRDDFYQLIAQI